MTIRSRDTMTQERVALDQVVGYLGAASSAAEGWLHRLVGPLVRGRTRTNRAAGGVNPRHDTVHGWS